MADHGFLEKRFIKQDSFVWRRIAGEFILVPIGSNAGEMGSVYTLNEVGALIWELMNEETSVEKIRNVIVREYDVAESEAGNDIVELLQQLERIGAIREV
jgi:hypothetical protein